MQEGLRHWPKRNEAAGISMPLSNAIGILESLDPSEVTKSLQEFVIRGRVEAADLRRIQRLGFEVILSRNENIYVLATGTEGVATPSVEGYDIHDETKPSSLQRTKSSDATFHNHPDDLLAVDGFREPDEELGLVPSDGDLYVLKGSKRKQGLLATRKGLLIYQWPESKDDLMKRWRLMEYTEEANTVNGKRISSEMAWERFLHNEDVIVAEVPWEDMEGCQSLVDKYFVQEPIIQPLH